MRSWKAAGLRPVSLNPPGEIPELRRVYGDACEFREAHRTGTSATGRTLVPVADLLLLSARLDPGRYAMVMNADLQWAPGVPIAPLRQASRHAVSMIRRILVDPARPEEAGQPDPYGWDGVMLGPDLASSFACPDFLLGMPWWDYWIPARAIHLGLPLLLWEGRLALHPRHEEVWDERDRARLAPRVLAEIGRGPWSCRWRRWIGPKAERKIYRHPNHLAGFVRAFIARHGQVQVEA